MRKRKKKAGEEPPPREEIRDNPIHLKQLPAPGPSEIKQIELGVRCQPLVPSECQSHDCCKVPSCDVLKRRKKNQKRKKEIREAIKLEEKLEADKQLRVDPTTVTCQVADAPAALAAPADVPAEAVEAAALSEKSFDPAGGIIWQSKVRVVVMQ